ncbi:SOS response transcriptional repressor, RecA-mediated autopeptidase [Candidatus Methanoperedens nitroreducens]|uniref:SOS response transcriptional repressor, RecA-mediated autopeptidase n=1 Tax=Candidatus Methanoperedens nitratireducens TaxID=1392998 RepID=A0A062VCG9_9EURY|nr:organomercurial lyase [Candidatus Methanoperedens nitroreducens]KCZ72930.1 SOS response transcriptional repressor, RecA-mediated autopeptidase [Candidatus Methanoperedens nitroreducens]MDJ1423142.1 organomercurial lyase [Candidatus Methanoperedens sp.]
MKRRMDTIGETVKGHIAEAKLSPLQDEIRKYILMRFVKDGRPPSPKEIMEELGLSSADAVHQTIEKLQKFDIIMRKNDEIISAYPFSATETRHKVIFEDGHEVYALCATDALGIHFMLDKGITILSRCPECEKEMRIAVKDGKINSCNPEEIIEFVSDRERGGCTAETLCPFINFFCAREHLQEWRKKNPEFKYGEIYSLDEALEHGKTIFGNFLK